MAQSIPGNEEDIKFDSKVLGLDLEQSEVYRFTFKTKGTSIGFKVGKVGKRNSGLFLPENSSTHLEGEIVSYRLSRIIGVSDIFNPVSYYTIGSVAVERFRQMLRPNERNKWRKKNTKEIRKRINSNPDSLDGIYKFRHKRESQSVDSLAVSNRLNANHRFAKLLQADGPSPKTELVTIQGVIPDKPEYPKPLEMEIVLAKQLSNIFAIDMLTGQWDRFSGGNIEAYAHKDGRLQFVSRDNGGSHLLWGWNWFNKYRGWLTRFDMEVIDKLKELNAFLNESKPNFGDFSSPDEFRKLVGFSSERSFKAFKEKLDVFINDHVKVCEDRFGSACYFSV